MNRKTFFKRLGIGIGAMVVAPKLLIPQNESEIVRGTLGNVKPSKYQQFESWTKKFVSDFPKEERIGLIGMTEDGKYWSCHGEVYYEIAEDSQCKGLDPKKVLVIGAANTEATVCNVGSIKKVSEDK